jgi:acetylornithine deacetylase/succinyl-diaminopimelate desuccinylase-like protein
MQPTRSRHPKWSNPKWSNPGWHRPVWRQLLTSLMIGVMTLGVGAPCVAESNPAIAAVDTEDLSETTAWLQEYLQIDTTNPPGNEMRAVDFFARIFKAEGIEYQTAKSAPGRGNIWARLKGGDEPAILLLHHSDVVTADREFWDVDPLGGEIRDGHLYGRGALDMKSHGIVHLAAFLALHRDGVALNRDVVFMATADEEAGSRMGMGWMVKNRPKAFAGVGLALTEGGQATLVGNRIALGVEVTQKIPLWVRLRTTGPAGHGSTPRVDSALGSLIDAMTRLRAHEFEPHIVPPVDNYFKRLAPNFPGKLGTAFADIEQAIQDPAFRRKLHESFPNLSALTQNTCAITRATGSTKVNVVAPTASAEMDCRLLPDQDPLAFLAELQSIVDDDAVSIDPLLSYLPSASATDTVLFEAIEGVMGVYFPDVEAVPTISSGFTDSHYLREHGIASYGFGPFVVPVGDISGYHGNNERISIENIERGAELLQQILIDVVTPLPDAPAETAESGDARN